MLCEEDVVVKGQLVGVLCNCLPEPTNGKVMRRCMWQWAGVSLDCGAHLTSASLAAGHDAEASHSWRDHSRARLATGPLQQCSPTCTWQVRFTTVIVYAWHRSNGVHVD